MNTIFSKFEGVLQGAKVFDPTSHSHNQDQPLDELPLVNASTFSKQSKGQVGSESTHFPTEYPTHTYRPDNAHLNGYVGLDDGIQRGEPRRYRDRINAFINFLRASGPARRLDSNHQPLSNKARKLPTGWRLGTWVCCAAVVLCVILEVSLLVYALLISRDGRGSGVLLIGNCHRVRELELWLLLPLNIAGTILIGTSNYVMQVVSAPERKEIDLSHGYARYVSVAGIRFRDLRVRTFNRSRQSIWWILCLSSVPIHFLLNVAVFSSVQASNNAVLVVQENFDRDKGWSICGSLPQNATTADLTACALYTNFNTGHMRYYNAPECLRQYSDGFQTNASSVIVVTEQSSQRWLNPPSNAMALQTQSYGLLCRKNETSDPSNVKYYAISDPAFTFVYDNHTGTTISTNFLPYCQNVTRTKQDGSRDMTLWEISPSDRSTALSTQSIDELALRANSSLTNIDSIKAFFSAFQYRYWGVAWSVGDFTRGDIVQLMQSKDPRGWVCPREDLERAVQCNPLALQQQNEWRITPESMLVKGCYILPKEEKCTLRYSSGVLIITLIFDLIKLSAMVTALKLIKQPLATLGDVIASFLSEPDPCTEKCGPLAERQVLKWIPEFRERLTTLAYTRFKECFGRNSLLDGIRFSRCPRCGDNWDRDDSIDTLRTNLYGFDSKHRDCLRLTADGNTPDASAEKLFDWLTTGGPWWSTLTPVPSLGTLRPEAINPRRWVGAASPSRWFFSTLLLILALASSTAYFTINYQSVRARKVPQPWATGFNAPDPNSMITSWLSNTRSIYVAAIIVNLPQMAFSMLYFIFNATLTLMHTGHEWAKFSTERKALRVSNPRGQQRSTYWLQLPWAYSIPLILVSGGMHWLLSRSLYVVKVDAYDHFGERLADDDYYACGYSPIPALLLVVVIVLMGAAIIGLAARKLPEGMPLVRLNSLAIASACHPNPAEQDLELRPLMFGVVDGYLVDGQPHKSFTAEPLAYERLWSQSKVM